MIKSLACPWCSKTIDCRLWHDEQTTRVVPNGLICPECNKGFVVTTALDLTIHKIEKGGDHGKS